MKPSDFMPPSTVFTGALVGHVKRLLNNGSEYMAHRGRAQGGGAHVLHVRDVEDGQFYRVTIEPESAALAREDEQQRVIDAVQARVAQLRGRSNG